METADFNQTPVRDQISPKPESKISKLIYLGIFVVLVLIIALLVWYIFSLNKTPKTAVSKKQATNPATASAKVQSGSIGYVTALAGLNLRKDASDTAEVLLTLPFNTKVSIISTEGDWYFIQATTKGFVSKEFISSEKQSGASLKTFSDPSSPFTFLYPDLYTVSFSQTDSGLSYSFSGNQSYGGFTVTSEKGLVTLGNYSLTHYNAPSASCDVKFGGNPRECEQVNTTQGSIYLVLINNILYKFSYLKTEGGLLTDLNNLVFTSLVFK